LAASAGDGELGWALANAVAAYLVLELGGTLEDPQDGSEFGPGDGDELDARVRSLVEDAWEDLGHRLAPPPPGSVSEEPITPPKRRRGLFRWGRRH
jgi:hypothetical protein